MSLKHYITDIVIKIERKKISEIIKYIPRLTNKTYNTNIKEYDRIIDYFDLLFGKSSINQKILHHEIVDFHGYNDKYMYTTNNKEIEKDKSFLMICENKNVIYYVTKIYLLICIPHHIVDYYPPKYLWLNKRFKRISMITKPFGYLVYRTSMYKKNNQMDITRYIFCNGKQIKDYDKEFLPAIHDWRLLDNVDYIVPYVITKDKKIDMIFDW